jgi:glycosyltransferase involved in cell wall biosynthesis
MEPPYILAIGTVEPRKGLPDLVAAFDRVADSMPDVCLKIAGPPGWGEDALTGARLLAYPSLYEGFGLPPLEAMSLGVPVVATTAGAIPEVVGDAAVLVAPRDVPALAEALRVVAEDASVRDQLIALGTERVRLFSWQRAGQQLAHLYRTLADARP